MTTVIKNAQLYSVSMTGTPLPSTGWTNLGYTTSTNGFQFSSQQQRKKPRPYQYLIAIDEKSGERFKVQWKKHSVEHEVWVGLTLIGETWKHLDGYWLCRDRFGTINKGFASRKMASRKLLEDHFQYTPSLETNDDYDK